jgi:nucleoid DNA-binding protein
MNSSELGSVVAEAHEISKAQAQAILDSVLKSIVKAAASNDEVSLAGFGEFKVKLRQNARAAIRQMARKSRLPHRRSCRFRRPRQ